MLSLVSKGRCPNITQIAQQLLCNNKVHYTVQECFNVSFTQANKSVYFRNLISYFSHHYEITIHITVPLNPKSPLKVIHTDVKQCVFVIGNHLIENFSLKKKFFYYVNHKKKVKLYL